jgi:ribosomal-protein-serine acetyltransferase
MFTCTLNDNACLKPLEIRHAADIYNLIDSNREHLRRWLPFIDNTRHVIDSEVFVRAMQNQYILDGSVSAGIWYKEEMAGVIGMHSINWSNGATTIGYWLGEGFQGKGLVTLSVKAFLNYSFTELNLHRLELRAGTENSRSRGVAERLSFTHEGTLRDAEWLYDRFIDLEVYAMLKSDWTEVK